MTSVHFAECDRLEDSASLYLADMAWAKRQHSKGQIDRAGGVLVDPRDQDEYDWALDVVNNWRTCHSYPLQIVTMTLRHRAKKVNSSALIAQRLKRLPSIALKLSQNTNMKLSQMQDIGGCRVVLPSMRDVRNLMEVYDESRAKNPRSGRPIENDRNDYIENPKPDGYRSIHLIFKYQSQYPDKQEFNGQRIEIQVRSQLQHAWATAVETVQAFTGHALKSKIKSGDPDWLRFFALMGSALALRERQPLVPGTPAERTALVNEIRFLSGKLRVEDCLRGWGFAIEKIARGPVDSESFLLVLDTAKKIVTITPFGRGAGAEANEEYLKVEKEMKDKQEISAVLVSVESLEELRAAYPNYFLDTNLFLDALKKATSLGVAPISNLGQPQTSES